MSKNETKDEWCYDMRAVPRDCRVWVTHRDGEVSQLYSANVSSKNGDIAWRPCIPPEPAKIPPRRKKLTFEFISREEREPTYSDADCFGEVLVLFEGSLDFVSFQELNEKITHWAPLSELKPEDL